jgi:hypothetical protein
MTLEGLQASDIPKLPLQKAMLERDCADRFCSKHPGWLEEHLGAIPFDWRGHFIYIDTPELLSTFSVPEVLDIWLRYSNIVGSDQLDSYFEREHFLVWKCHNSFWHFGCGGYPSYSQIRRTLNSLRNLVLPDAFTSRGFELRLTHTSYFNTQGHAVSCSKHLWLDAPFGALLYYKGSHVLTMSFGVGQGGVYLTQIQLRQKKGNRFLFSLGSHHLDFAVGLLSSAFGRTPLWLVTGSSAVEGVRKSYKVGACTMTDADALRIQSFYDHPLTGYNRTGKVVECQGRKYERIEKC